MKNNTEMENIIQDLKLLFKKKDIPAEEFEEFLRKLKSDSVKHYLETLKNGSKPEQALKDVFFSHGSEFIRVFGKAAPEVFMVKTGFVDYVVEGAGGKKISVEIKPPFIAEFQEERGGNRIFKGIKKQDLDYKKYEEQIMKYLKAEGEYLIFTNLEKWLFFSESSSRPIVKPYEEISFDQFIEEFRQIGDLYKFADRKEELSLTEPLDERFFQSLDTWVNELKKVKYTVDNKIRDSLIINLINKLIFIQSLDKLWVGPFKYFESNWFRLESEWAGRKREILEEFLRRTDYYFYRVYDTELFREYDGKTIFDFIEKTEENIDLFYKKLKIVLGIDFASWHVGWVNGIIQYNFRYIDEDILGKAYEKYLAKIRKEKGIYYTPKYITQYIVENTVGKIYDELIAEIKKSLEKEDFDMVQKLVKNFISIRVLDPACGSGSFLIKALRVIWDRYIQLEKILNATNHNLKQKKSENVSTFAKFEDDDRILQIKKTIGYGDKRKLMSKIILRHIHGNDLDPRALEVAKINIWLEAIKLIPTEFRYDQLPKDTNHILPNLEMNLGNGDSLVGLPEDKTIKILKENYKDDLKRLFELRNEYLDAPTNEEAIKKINEIKKKLREKLDEEFKKYLEENNLPLEILEKTKPFHWALDFWFVFFDENLEPKPKEERGFDAVIGNPPYFTIRGKGTGTLLQTFYYNYLQNSPIWRSKFRSQSDIYYYFTIQSIELLKRCGKFGFIIENYWLENDYADGLKESILNNTKINILINFGNIKIFEDAENDTCILILEKYGKISEIKYVFCKNTFDGNTRYEQNQKLLHHILQNIHKVEHFDKYIEIFSINQKQLGLGKWTLSKQENVLARLKKDGNKILPLADLSKNIFDEFPNDFLNRNEHSLEGIGIVAQGMSPGAKDVFSLSLEKAKELHIELEVLKPLILNSHIKRYRLIDSNMVIIYPYYIDTIEKFPNVKKYLEKNKNELISGSDRKKLLEKNKIRWLDFSVYRNREIFERQEKKILCPYRAIENSFALDCKGYFGTTDIYAIIPKKDSNINIYYLLGILNSKLLTFWYREAGKTKGGMLEFFTTPLKRMPIYKATPEEQTPIIQLVQKIMTLKNLQHKFRELWRYYSRKFRNNYKSLGEILLDDKKSIQEGNFDKVWIKEASIYPDEQNELLEKEFKEFRIVGENDNKLKIYGTEGQKEELILEITTSKKEFRDIIYLELLELLDSRVKKKTLRDLLSKSEISVIQPNIWENSENLIKMTKEQFEKWVKKQKIEIKEDDIVKIDNEIQEIDNLIDAHVFKLYGLNRAEVEIVLDSLGILESIKNDIIKKFDGLSK